MVNRVLERVRQRDQETPENVQPGLNPDAPDMLREHEGKSGREAVKAFIKANRPGEAASVDDEGRARSENEQRDPESVKADNALKNTSALGRVVRGVIKSQVERLDQTIGWGEFLKQTLAATGGIIAGTTKGFAETLIEGISSNIEQKVSFEDRQKIKEEIRNLGPIDPDTPLDPQYFGMLQQIVQDQEDMEYLAETPGSRFLKRQQEVLSTPIFNYTPQSITGQQIEHTVMEGLEHFEEWGSDFGDFVMEKTNDPMLAATAETSVAGLPYYFPLGFNRTARMVKSGAERIKRNKRRRETDKDRGDFAPEMETAETVSSSGRMSPDEILSRVDKFPTEEMLLNRGFRDTAQIVEAYKGSRQKRPVILEMSQDGKLRVVDGDLEVFARSLVKNSKKKPLDVEIIQDVGDAPFNRQASARMNKVFADAEAAGKVTIGDRLSNAWRVLLEQGFDHSHRAKSAMIRDAGQAGRNAVTDYELTAGATIRGKLKWQGWEDRIYSGLSREEVAGLDRLVFNERVRQIDAIHGIGKKKHPNNTTAIEATENLKALKNEIGAAEYRKLQSRAEIYFEAPRQVLDELYVEGIITKSLRDKLKQHRYEPRRLIEELDKSEKFEVPGSAPINVTDSGIKKLDKGTARALETDARSLMAEYVIRMENRMMRNEAIKSLGKVGEVEGVGYIRKPEVTKWTKDGFAKGVKTPDGMVRLNYWENGRQQPVFMEAEMAKVWTNNVLLGDPRTANLMRKLSGSFLIRPLATGYNPGFAVRNLPRDILHAYLATDQYAVTTPKFMFQITGDLARTARDAWKKDGRFTEYINEGGGLDFLTHQGRDLFVSRSVGEQAAKSSVGLRKWKEGLSKINEFSEVWVRLAIRDRAMRNGRSSKDATWAARRYLDFSQGGMLAKQVDHVVPYTNAALQAFRTTARAAKERPARFAAKVTNLMATAAAIQLSGFFTNPDAIKDVPEHVRRMNFIIPLPESFSYTDPRTGEYKHRYITIARDNTMNWFTVPLEMAMEKYLYDITPDKELTGELADLFRASAPVVPTELDIPAKTMMDTYLSNWDGYFGDEVWHGPKVSPEQEFRELPSKPTPRIWKEWGELTGMSPVRSERSFRKIVPHNDYLDSMLFGFEKGLAGMTLEERQRTTGQWFQEAPILNRLFHETHPGANQQIAIEKGMEETGDRRIRINREVDRQFFLYKKGEQTKNEFKDWVRNSVEKEDKDRAINRWELNHWLEKSLTHGGQPPGVGGIPPRREWLAMSNMDGVARAQYFYERWRSMDANQRRRMEQIGKQLSKTGKSFWNREFHQEFERQKEQRGTDEY